MFRSRKMWFTQICRCIWFVVSLATVMAPLHPIAAKAETIRQESLPVCPTEGNYEIYPSPFYGQDQTLFLKEYSPRNPRGFVLWRSNDGGHFWSVMLDITNLSGLNMGPTYPVPIPPDPDFQLYLATWFGVSLGTSNPMLWYSNDGGVTWEARNPCAYDCISWLYPTNQSDVLFGLEHYDPWGHFSSGIWRTTDGARSEWTKVWDGTEAISLAVSPSYAQDHTLFGGLRVKSPELGSAVIASTNGGETWEGRGGDDLCDNDTAAVQLSSTFSQDHTAFVQQARSLFRSQDAGETWAVLFPRDQPHCQPGMLAPTVDSYKLSTDFGQDHTIYMTTTGPDEDHHLLVSSDGGATWTQLLSRDYHFSLLGVFPRVVEATSVLDRSSWNNISWAREAEAYYDTPPARLNVPGHNQEWLTFLPRIDWTGSQPTAKPFTLFLRTSDAFSYYRSDDGGVTWGCMELPPPLPPQSTPTRDWR